MLLLSFLLQELLLLLESAAAACEAAELSLTRLLRGKMTTNRRPSCFQGFRKENLVLLTIGITLIHCKVNSDGSYGILSQIHDM